MAKSVIPLAGIFLLVQVTSAAQTINLKVGSGAWITGGANLYVHLPGDIRADGIINSAASSNWSFSGTSGAQLITCGDATGCTNIYNTGNYYVNLGNVRQYNTDGIAVDINTIVQTVHYFDAGTTEIKEGNYWLTQTSATPYSGNDNSSKFFVTSGHGLLKQSNVSAAGTFYPVGNAANTDNYIPITISYSGTADTFGVRVFDNIYFSYNSANGDAAGGINNYRFVKKTWIVKKSNRTIGDYFTITPQWNLVNEETNFTPRRPTDISIARNHDGFWLIESTQGPATPPTGAGPFSYSGVVTYDNSALEYYPVSVTAINAVLASNDLKLTGSLSGNNVLLKWFVLAPEDVFYYEVQRSNDAIHFETAGKVMVQAANEHNYQYLDALSSVQNNVLYYRIKQVDRNNNYYYSNIITLKRNTTGVSVLLYPNPAKDIINVLFTNTSGSYNVQLTDMWGRVIKNLTVKALPGNSLQLPCSALSGGIYFINLLEQQTKTRSSFKIVINR
jgi:hypothetical protein